MLVDQERASARAFVPSFGGRARESAHRVAVIGGGITGLTVAWELARRGIDVVVYEASERPGGVIDTDRRGPWMVERGPNSLAVTDPVCALVTSLGLESEVVTSSPAARRRYVARGSELLPVPMAIAAGLGGAVAATAVALGVAWLIARAGRSSRGVEVPA